MDDKQQKAIEMKNCKQETSAMKEMKRYAKAAEKSGAGIGAVVTLKVDHRTYCHAPGLLAIAFDFKSDSGGILVCCQHGVITHDGMPGEYWVPCDRYKVVADKDTTFPIPPELQSVRDMVLAGTFDLTAQGRRISYLTSR